jgi:hypothetical protein
MTPKKQTKKQRTLAAMIAENECANALAPRRRARLQSVEVKLSQKDLDRLRTISRSPSKAVKQLIARAVFVGIFVDAR